MLTHFASLDLIAIAAQLDQGTGSRVERSEVSAIRVLLSSMTRCVVSLSRGGFSSIVRGNLPKELTIDFA